MARAAVVTPPPPSPSPSVQKESVPLLYYIQPSSDRTSSKDFLFFSSTASCTLCFLQKGHFDPRAEMMVDVWSEKLLTRYIKETSQKVWPSALPPLPPLPLPPPPHISSFPFLSTIELRQTPKVPWILSSSPYTYSDSLVAGHYACRQATAISTMLLAHYRRPDGRTNGRSYARELLQCSGIMCV